MSRRKQTTSPREQSLYRVAMIDYIRYPVFNNNNKNYKTCKETENKAKKKK